MHMGNFPFRCRLLTASFFAFLLASVAETGFAESPAELSSSTRLSENESRREGVRQARSAAYFAYKKFKDGGLSHSPKPSSFDGRMFEVIKKAILRDAKRCHRVTPEETASWDDSLGKRLRLKVLKSLDYFF